MDLTLSSEEKKSLCELIILSERLVNASSMLRKYSKTYYVLILDNLDQTFGTSTDIIYRRMFEKADSWVGSSFGDVIFVPDFQDFQADRKFNPSQPNFFELKKVCILENLAEYSHGYFEAIGEKKEVCFLSNCFDLSFSF